MYNFKYLSETLSLTINTEKCNGCGMCINVCPHAVFKIENKKATVPGYEYCMECGACKLNCPTKAITMNVGNGCGCATGIIEGYFNKNSNECACGC